MTDQHVVQPFDVGVVEFFEIDHLWIEVLTESPLRVVDVAMPPDMPAAKLRPVDPRITTLPPVMYSQPWSPTPSTTACAWSSGLRNARRPDHG